MSCTPMNPIRARKRTVWPSSFRDSLGNPMMMFSLTFSPLRTAPRTEASSRSSFTTFLMRLRTSGEPLSGA